MSKGGVVIVIDDDRGRKKSALVAVGVAAVAVLLTLVLVLVFYHPLSKPVLYLVIYNPSNQPTTSPHDQPITIPCIFLQYLWNESFGYAPSCQAIADNVTFTEGGQILPAYPIVSGDLITWWVRMPGIPPKTNVTITMILGNSSSITNPANVFLIYGGISSFQPGYIYVLDTVGNGITVIYNQSSASPFIYVANGSAWLFTPNSNPASNGFSAQSIGTGYLSIAVTPGGQYLVSTTQSPYMPFQSEYQLTSLSGVYSVAYVPQSVLDTLSRLGAAYVAPLVNPPTYGTSSPMVSTHPFYIQLPQCNITSNPYTGTTGLFGLLNCLAIQNGGLWSVIRFYYQPGDEGAILGFSNYQYPTTPVIIYTPWVYVGTNGYLYVGDWIGALWQVSFPLTPGWHTLVVGEYYSNGAYYVVAYLDNSSNIKTATTTSPPQLFGLGGSYPYSDAGTGHAEGLWPNTNHNWFFYTDVIGYVALYGGGASVGSSLVNNVFSIVSQQQQGVLGYAIDYPPGGVEPGVIIIYLKTPSGLSTLLPSQLGIINYEIRIVGS